MNIALLTPDRALVLVLAIVLLLGGHVARAARWAVLLGREQQHGLRIRFTALAFGYVINAIAPLRLGEWCRALMFAQGTRSKLSHTIASIIVERAYDLVAISVMLLALSHWIAIEHAAPIAGAMLLLAIAVFTVTASIRRFAAVRKLIWLAADVFNPQIRFALLDTAMALGEVERDVRAHARRFLLQTLMMWGTYMASYVAIAYALQVPFSSIFDFFFGNAFRAPVVEMIRQGSPASAFISLYAVVPCALVILYERLKHFTGLRLGAHFGWIAAPLLAAGPRAQDRFGDSGLYGDFLRRHFVGAGDTALDFETHAIGDATVLRQLRGGSDAITAVVRVGAEVRFRKYALDGAARKLHDQYRWLAEHRLDLPVVPLVQSRSFGNRFLYDMPYSTTARDFYDYLHMSPLECSWNILRDILERIDTFHQRHFASAASDDVVVQYIEQKVHGNLAVIRQSFPQLFEQSAIRVNGKDVAIGQLESFAGIDRLLPQLRARPTSIIHGDLTIENIIFDPVHHGTWYLIDPNIGNVFESPLLDYAKLLQSLHLGYESLNRDHPCYLTSDGIEFFMPRTNLYEALFHKTESWLRERFGDGTYREIRLHEIVHYFRLIPYKIRKSPQRGLLFLGCLCLLIDRYNEEFGSC